MSIHTVHGNLCERFVELEFVRHIRNVRSMPPFVLTPMCVLSQG